MDREKVIRGLEELCKYLFHEYEICYHGDQEDIYNRFLIADNALALLKEQEAKTGAWQWKIHGKPESGGTLGEAVCDQCGESTYATAVKGTLNYCPNCGAKMTDRR